LGWGATSLKMQQGGLKEEKKKNKFKC